ncbi:MAG: amidohydrolase family protein [Proteobacteria bacterium]|nr:amidohydrolase family protein [Pseudomonadota bacterium]
MQIDAHQHFWSIARKDYGWLTPELPALWRDFTPDDLKPLIDTAGISRTILVQAAPTEAETRFLLDVAGRTPWVAGVVGWADFTAPDAPARIAALARNPLLVGLRPMVQDIADDQWLTRDNLAPAFAALTAHQLVFDALVLPRHLKPLLTVLERHPTLSVVVDHAAKPDIARCDFAAWRRDLAAVAQHSHVMCKLSGLVTEAAADWRPADLAPVFDDLMALFGPARLLWGSDWPVVTLRASYAEWRAASLALLSPCSDNERAAILGGNAARLYLASRGRKSGC